MTRQIDGQGVAAECLHGGIPRVGVEARAVQERELGAAVAPLQIRDGAAIRVDHAVAPPGQRHMVGGVQDAAVLEFAGEEPEFVRAVDVAVIESHASSL
jgi:hypothetical protein